MIEDMKRMSELIAANKPDLALKIFTGLTSDDKDMHDQVLMLAAKFNDVRKRENLNLINLDDAFVIRAQVNYALLNLMNEFEKKILIPLPADARKTVFISYSHSDSVIVNKLKDKLTAHKINVTIDSEKMQAGEDIKEFIERSVRDTETTVSIVSKKSLLSAWVAMETINTYYHEKTNNKKKFIPCYVEDDFFNRNFTDDALDIIDRELKEIETIKKARADKGRNTRDLNNEYTRLKELSNGIDEVIRRLRESLCIDIRDESLDNNFIKILEKIQS